MASAGDNSDACPVDHHAREEWLKQARAASDGNEAAGVKQGQLPTPNPHVSAAATTVQPPSSKAQTPSSSSSWASTLRSYNPFSSSTSTASTSAAQSSPSPASNSDLDTHRVISSIPRTPDGPAADGGCPVPHDQRSNPDAATGTGPPGPAAPPAAVPAAVSHGSRPANSEADTGYDKKTGNWVYPSEKMFFDAMKRKGHDQVQTADMKTVVPIHNAVNERAWKEIKEWERPYIEGTACAGPRLHSFTGLSERMSPKARINTILGYTAPFDRHDWIVDRCGTQVEYVIDFYAGRPGANDPSGRPSFYLDVRPKLNSWEGVRMRAYRGLGLS